MLEPLREIGAPPEPVVATLAVRQTEFILYARDAVAVKASAALAVVKRFEFGHRSAALVAARARVPRNADTKPL